MAIGDIVCVIPLLYDAEAKAAHRHHIVHRLYLLVDRQVRCSAGSIPQSPGSLHSEGMFPLNIP